MKQRQTKNIILFATGPALVLLVGVISRKTLDTMLLNQAKSLLYLIVNTAVVGLWGLNCERRILDGQVRRYVVTMACMILLFLLLRTTKYYITHVGTGYQRFLWYMYYIPVFMIPYCGVMTAYLCRKKKAAEVPQALKAALLMPSVVLLVIILTNELHGLVFRIAPDYIMSADYDYRPLYYVIFAWVLILVTAALVLCAVAGHAEGRKAVGLWPLFTVGGFYGFFYVIGGPVGQFLYDNLDFTTFFSMLSIVVIEYFIHCGLIPVNSDYEWCFDKASLNMQILDRDGRARYVSANASPIDEDMFKRLASGHGSLEEGDHNLKLQEIKGGYVLVETDRSRLLKLRDKVKKANDELDEVNCRLRESIANAGKKEGFAHASALYKRCFEETRDAFNLCRELIEKAKAEGVDDEEKSRLMKLLNIHGAYIKRRSNLVILNDGQSENAGGEFALCMHETFNNLKLYGTEVKSSIKELKDISIEDVIYAYDVFEHILMKKLHDIKGIYFIAAERGGKNLITIQLDTDGKDISGELYEDGERVSCEYDDEGVTVRIRPRGLGEASLCGGDTVG